jgi:type IV secretory pathway VirJ component
VADKDAVNQGTPKARGICGRSRSGRSCGKEAALMQSLWRKTVLLSAWWFASCAQPAPVRHESGEWGRYDVWLPRGEVKALVFLLSPETGVGREERAAAVALNQLGAVVAVVDTRIYLERVGGTRGPGERDTCLDVPGAFLWTSHFLQKEMELPVYRPPYLVGRGAGGALAYVALAQSRPGALAGGVSVDLRPTLPIRRPLCGIRATATRHGWRLGVYRLGGQWRVAGTRAISADLLRWYRAAAARNARPAVDPPPPRSYPVLLEAVLPPLMEQAEEGRDEAAERMPVVEVEEHSPRGVLAVIYSGDGGWRDIDKSIGTALAQGGLAVVGVDVLSYFWSKRSPDEVGRDTAGMLRYYMAAWRQRRAALVGYSFGAEILPFVYNRLPPDLQKDVVLLSLLAPSRTTGFEVNIADWLGAGPGGDALLVAPELTRVPGAKVQCFYGEEEADDSLCTDPAARGVEVVRRPGSHHFDGDYAALGAMVLRGILERADRHARAPGRAADTGSAPR